MNIRKLILSGFGAGFLPLMPGTWASLLLLAAFLTIHYFWPATFISVIFLLFVLILSSASCLLFAEKAEKEENKKDPCWIVMDEFAGLCVGLLPVAVISRRIFLSGIGGFILFRIFDILKPSPARECELLKGGLGILADDIVAGLMTGVSVEVISYLFTFIK